MPEIIAVDTKGLSKMLCRNGIGWIAKELLQNAWDQDVTQVDMTVESIGHGRGKITITDDDPVGFQDLNHSYTLFAESTKRGDPNLRGRFNMGEKQVIVYCIETGGEVEILSTTGGYHFDKKKGRTKLRRKTDVGSTVTCTFRASKKALEQMTADISTFIAPTTCVTTLNGITLPTKAPVTSFREQLPTIGINSDGEMFNTARKTDVDIYEPAQGETPMLMELGIPVVVSGTKYHIDVRQKVPLNMERDSVTPAYRKQLLGYVVNAVHKMLTKEEANEGWVLEGTGSKEISPDALNTVLDHKFGKGRMVHDPTNQGASTAATNDGRTVVSGGSLPKEVWEQVKEKAPIPTTTSNSDYRDDGIKFSPNGKDVSIPENEWSDEMVNLTEYARELHQMVHGKVPSVRWLKDDRSYRACYSDNRLTFNYNNLGKKWIERTHDERWYFQDYIDLLIHEFSHHGGAKHYDRQFYINCTENGAKVATYMGFYSFPDWYEGEEKK
tara:strand:- start:5257 stop:6747 length:1491 start_codon:yes stop_codon:yes gene_type:complete